MSLNHRLLQFFVTTLGVVALVAGSSTMILGAESVIGVEDYSATLDSELRFFSVWYAATGVVLLRVSRRVASETMTIRAVSIAFFLAGCTRIVSLIAVGRPHDFALVLMVLELSIPLVLVPWQAAVRRREGGR